MQSQKNKPKYPDLEFNAISLAKLKTSPQYRYILSLMMLINDFDSVVCLNELLDKAEKEDHQDFYSVKRREGAILYLLRQQSSILYESLNNTISDMKGKIDEARQQNFSEKSPLTLWRMIISDSELDQQFTKLVELFQSSGKDSLGYVRDKFGAHYDESFFGPGLEALLKKTETGISFRNMEPQRFRAVVIDQIVSEAWQCKITKEENQEKRSEDINLYSLNLRTLKTSTADFVYRLFNTYCDKFSLYASPEERSMIKEEISAFQSELVSSPQLNS